MRQPRQRAPRASRPRRDRRRPIVDRRRIRRLPIVDPRWSIPRFPIDRCRLPITHPRLPIPRLPIDRCRLPIVHLRLPIPRLPIDRCRLPIVHLRLPIPRLPIDRADCRLSILDCRFPDCRSTVADCRLSILDCRFPDRDCRFPDLFAMVDCRFPDCRFGWYHPEFVRVLFLGTGTSHGVPMIGCDCVVCRSTDPRDARLRPSIVVDLDDGVRVLVDTTPDLRTQALRHDVRRLDAVFFTHAHADHMMGLDELRRYNALSRRAMPVYADAPTLDNLRRTFSYVFEPDAPRGGGVPDLRVVADRRAVLDRPAGSRARACQARALGRPGISLRPHSRI